MTTSTMSRVSRFIRHLKRVWADLDYAQRRLFEINTGIEVTRRESPRISTEELEALYAYQPPEEAPSPTRGDSPPPGLRLRS